jgi:hypothetical protein
MIVLRGCAVKHKQTERCSLQHPVKIGYVRALLAYEQAAFHKIWTLDRARRSSLGGIQVQAGELTAETETPVRRGAPFTTSVD